MKRRTENFKQRSRRKRKFRFETTQLETRQLLAGDVSFAASTQPFDIDFIGPIQLASVAPAVETCSHSNSIPTGADDQSCTDGASDGENRIVTEQFSFVGGEDFSSPDENSNRSFFELESPEVPEDATTRGVEESPAPTQYATITISSEGPIAELLPVEPAPTSESGEVIYFDDSDEDSNERSGAVNESGDERSRTGLLARHQILGLISPSELVRSSGPVSTPGGATGNDTASATQGPVNGTSDPHDGDSGQLDGDSGQRNGDDSGQPNGTYGPLNAPTSHVATSDKSNDSQDRQFQLPAFDVRISENSDFTSASSKYSLDIAGIQENSTTYLNPSFSSVSASFVQARRANNQ